MHRWLIPLALWITACTTPPVDNAPVVNAPVVNAPVEQASATAAPQTPPPATGEWTNFGEPLTGAFVLEAGAFLSDPSAHLNKNVIVEGRITEVCQQAGCWLVLSHEDKHIRVRMSDEGFSVDKDSSGSRCQVQGTVVEKKLDPIEVAHFASETRDGGVVPELAAAHGRTFEIIADGVRIATGT